VVWVCLGKAGCGRVSLGKAGCGMFFWGESLGIVWGYLVKAGRGMGLFRKGWVWYGFV